MNQTFMMVDTTNQLLSAVLSGDIASVRTLVMKGSDVNQEDEYGFTPLMIASLHGQLESVQVFVKARADVNKTCENTTALMLAASISRFELERVYRGGALFPVTRKMVGDSLSLQSSTDDKRGSLLKEILKNKTLIVDCLLRAGADPTIRDESGRNALILVTESGPSKCFGGMFEMWIPELVQTGVSTELVKRCQYLIDHNVDIDAADSDGMTALMHAVSNRLESVCELLLRHHADVNIVDNKGNTALMYSLLTGSKHLCRLLLQNGAILDIHNNQRQAALDNNSFEKSVVLCTALVRDEAKIDVDQDLYGATNAVTLETEGLHLQFSVRTVRHDVKALTRLWDNLCLAYCRKSVTSHIHRVLSYDVDHSLESSGKPKSTLSATLLLIAVANNSVELCKFALDHGADANVKDNEDKPALINTVLVRSLNICELLFSHGACANFVDASGKTALMYAVSQGLLDFANVLITSGAKIGLQDVNGTTALMHAIHCKMDTCCQLLLRHGADVNLRNSCGRTALMYAASVDFDHGIQWLIENDADINLPDIKGRTALMYAALNDSTKACMLLVESEASSDIQDEDGMTAVLYCAQKSFKDPLSVLLSGGANPDLCDKKDASALLYTILNNSLDCCKLLIDHGVNINIQGPDLKYLRTLNSEANLDIRNKNSISALGYTIMYKRPELCKLLVKHGADVNFQDTHGRTLVMYCAIMANRKHYLDILHTRKPDLDIVDKTHKTALMHASRHDLPDICKNLVFHGADVNIRDTMGMSAMMHAVLENSYKCVESFLCLGVDLNEQKGYADVPGDNHDGYVNIKLQDLNKGKTAFQLAVLLDSDAICRLMINLGTDVNRTDRDGRTALMYAALHNCSKCFSLLIKCADLAVKDNKGRTVMFYAIKSDYIQKLQEMGLEDRTTSTGEIHVHVDSVLSLLMKDVNFFMHLQHSAVVPKILDNMLDQVCIILENGVSPTLEPCERSLLYKANCLQLPLRNSRDCLKKLHLETCINTENNQLLRLLVCNGVVPARGSQTSAFYPVMQNVLERGDEEVVKYLIGNCYLTDQDVDYMRNWGQSRDDSDANKILPEQMFQHPWPLVKLAFIAVSTALGAGPGRQARVSKTGLPVKLQDMLMFRQPAAQIPVREWDDIELCFDPVRYEELARPRPLLYYWPLGRQL